MALKLENFLFGKRYIGIEFFSLNGEDKIAYLEAERKKDDIVISQNEIFNAKDELLAQKSNFPAVIIINNSHTLHKEIAGVDPNDRKLLHKAFPNLQTEDFYYEIWKKETISIVSICRKQYVHDLLSSLKGSFKIAGLSLGLSSVSAIMQFDVPEILSTNTQLLYPLSEENIINNNQVSCSVYTINGLEIPSSHLLSFCAVLSLILPKVSTGNIHDYNSEILETYNQKTFFEKGIQIGLATILGSLLINFLIFSYYFDKTNEITQEVTLNRAGIENIIKIKDRIAEKEKQLNDITGKDSSHSSSVVNNLVKQLPSSILLSEINYHPLEKKIKHEEIILSQDKTITISGTTMSNVAFTAWVESLENFEYIKNVNIASFGKDTENKTVFSLQITLD